MATREPDMMVLPKTQDIAEGNSPGGIGGGESTVLMLGGEVEVAES
jgi:hypothetical protein